MNHPLRWIDLAAAGLLVIVGLAVNARNISALEAEAESLRVQAQERERLASENARLKTIQPSADQLARVEATRAGLARLNRELPALREKLAATDRPVPVPVKSGPEPARSSDAWHNVGRASPKAVAETALWAALHGEVDVLARLLVLEPAARRRAEVMLDGLPEAARAEYQTPEKLIALLGAKDVIPGQIQLLGIAPRSDAEVSMRLRLPSDRPNGRVANLTLRNTSEGWALVVPENAVQRYSESLRAPVVR